MSWLQGAEILWGCWAILWFALAWNVAKPLGRGKPVVQQSNLWSGVYMATMVLDFWLVFAPFFRVGVLGARLWPDRLAIDLAGLLLLLAGVAFACWARLHLGRYWSGVVRFKEGHQLIRTGPYRFARHPIYTGLLFGFIGTALIQGEVRGLIALALLCIAHIPKIKMEEAGLSTLFPTEYAAYRKEVKALIPFVY